jgi:hypothetical protein
LGPAIFGTSASFHNTTLFINPQLQTVTIDTSELSADGTGDLRIQLVANDTNLPVDSTKTNQIMDMSWNIRLTEPTNAQTLIDVTGQFTFTEDVSPDSVRTSEFQSFRLLQISSMFIDDQRQDVDALRYRNVAGEVVNVIYTPDLVNTLLPQEPTPLDQGTLAFDSLHTDDIGEPNGNTPSYRITVTQTAGPVTGSITPRVFFVSTQDVNDDNLGAWVHQDPSQQVIPAGTSGLIEYRVVATTDPLPSP